MTSSSSEVPCIIQTPFGSFKVYSTPNPDEFKLEPTSGYYYDRTTKFYYDKKTEYYFDSFTKEWKFWSDTYKTYIPIEGDDEEAKKELILKEKLEKHRRVAREKVEHETTSLPKEVESQAAQSGRKRSLEMDQDAPSTSKQARFSEANPNLPDTDLRELVPSATVKISNIPAYMTKERLRNMVEKFKIMPHAIKIDRKIMPTGDVSTTGFVIFACHEEALLWMDLNECMLKFTDGIVGILSLERGTYDQENLSLPSTVDRSSVPDAKDIIELTTEPSGVMESSKTTTEPIAKTSEPIQEAIISTSASTPTPKDWTCVKCSTSNNHARIKCFKCGTSKTQCEELEARGSHLIGTIPCDTLILQNIPEDLILSMDDFFKNFPEFTRKIYMSKSKLYCLMQVKSRHHADKIIKVFEKYKAENKVLSQEVDMNFAKKSLEEIMEENGEDFTFVSSVQPDPTRDSTSEFSECSSAKRPEDMNLDDVMKSATELLKSALEQNKYTLLHLSDRLDNSWMLPTFAGRLQKLWKDLVDALTQNSPGIKKLQDAPAIIEITKEILLTCKDQDKNLQASLKGRITEQEKIELEKIEDKILNLEKIVYEDILYQEKKAPGPSSSSATTFPRKKVSLQEKLSQINEDTILFQLKWLVPKGRLLPEHFIVCKKCANLGHEKEKCTGRKVEHKIFKKVCYLVKEYCKKNRIVCQKLEQEI